MHIYIYIYVYIYYYRGKMSVIHMRYVIKRTGNVPSCLLPIYQCFRANSCTWAHLVLFAHDVRFDTSVYELP